MHAFIRTNSTQAAESGVHGLTGKVSWDAAVEYLVIYYIVYTYGTARLEVHMHRSAHTFLSHRTELIAHRLQTVGRAECTRVHIAVHERRK